MKEELEKLNVSVIAIAQEDTDLESHGKFTRNFRAPKRLTVVADLDRKVTTSYDRTTAYLIDSEGIVRQIFPMIIHARPDWRAILAEATEL